MNIAETILQIILFPLAFAAVVFCVGAVALSIAIAAVTAYEEYRERLNNK